MPSDIMDQRGASTLCLQPAPASLICEEIHFPIERQVVFWKHDHVPDHSGTKAVPLMSNKRSTGLPMTSWRVGGQDCRFRPDLYVQPAPGCVDADKFGLNGTYYENGLFSGPLSETFDQKLKLSAKDVPLGQSVDVVNSNLGEDAPFESLEEIEAQTIGDLLPDDDDLLAGVVDVLEYCVQPNARDDIDDIFCSGGGMEVEEGDNFSCTKYFDARGEAASNGHQGALNCQFASEHPSRTLFVGNIESNVEEEELKALFEQFGDLRTLYTACKHQGFVIISYYDIRAARNAMRALQNKPLRHQKLDIHFSIPKDNLSEEDINQDTLVVFDLDSSVSNVDIHQIFGVYGGIKEVRESPHKHHQKFIKFYDVRAAEAALHALNRTYVSGKKIMLEPSRPGGARRCIMQHSPPELELESSGVWHGSPPNNSPARCYGPIPLGVISSSGLDSGSVQGPHPAVCTPARPEMETAFQRTCTGASHRLSSSSPTLVAPVGNHSNPSGHGELSRSFGQMKLGIQHMSGSPSHPHSGYNDVIEQGFPYNSTTMSPMAINSGSGEGVDVRHIHSVGSSSLSNHSVEHGESAFRYSGNGCCPLHVNQQYMWNNAAIYDQHHPGPMMWPNQPVIVNSILPQMHGLPGAPCHIVNTVLPLPHHHVGPAPAMNPSHWERREVYPGDMDVHAFYPSSPGSMGLSGNSPIDTLELDSHNIFPRDGGNCEESAHVRTTPPRQRCHFFHRRNLKVPSSDGPNNRARYRRSDSSANQADNKKQYELDVECIMRGEDSRTTLMIKNIPNKYTSKVLLAAIDEHSRGTYDFVYLPIDFRNNCNMGYAFINMIDPQQIIPFYQAFNGKKWEKFSSEKVAELAYARIQGKAALIAHFQNSSLMNEDKRCRPMLFHSGGPNAGDQEPFPVGVNIRSRPGRLRTACYEESRQESP